MTVVKIHTSSAVFFPCQPGLAIFLSISGSLLNPDTGTDNQQLRSSLSTETFLFFLLFSVVMRTIASCISIHQSLLNHKLVHNDRF